MRRPAAQIQHLERRRDAAAGFRETLGVHERGAHQCRAAHELAAAGGERVGLAHAAQTASAPIGCANGTPQTAHHGAAKNVIAFQQVAHSASGSPTVALHARQRGGKTPSITTRPIRSKCAGRVAASCIASHYHDILLHHPTDGACVNCGVRR
jgi:hypothetical protein